MIPAIDSETFLGVVQGEIREVVLGFHVSRGPRPGLAYASGNGGVFAGTEITVTAAPTRFDRMPALVATDFVPEVGGWRASYYAMHEWIGWIWYGVR